MTEPKPDPKLCKDCKWAVPDTNVFLRPIWNDNAECNSPKNIKGVNPVNGKAKRFLMFCIHLRSDGEFCGKLGDWWEPKQ